MAGFSDVNDTYEKNHFSELDVEEKHTQYFLKMFSPRAAPFFETARLPRCFRILEQPPSSRNLHVSAGENICFLRMDYNTAVFPYIVVADTNSYSEYIFFRGASLLQEKQFLPRRSEVKPSFLLPELYNTRCSYILVGLFSTNTTTRAKNFVRSQAQQQQHYHHTSTMCAYSNDLISLKLHFVRTPFVCPTTHAVMNSLLLLLLRGDWK